MSSQLSTSTILYVIPNYVFKSYNYSPHFSCIFPTKTLSKSKTWNTNFIDKRDYP